MKKLLIPSLLAGLMICIPTLSAHADDPPHYEPFDWETSGVFVNESSTYEDITRTESSTFTPFPAGISTSEFLSVSAPSSIYGNHSSGHFVSNDSSWQWSGGGAGDAYDEVKIIQFGATITLGDGGYAVVLHNSLVQTDDTNEDLSMYMYTDVSDMDQEVATYPKPGAAFLLSHIETGSNVYAECNGTLGSGAAQGTALGVAQIDYIVD